MFVMRDQNFSNDEVHHFQGWKQGPGGRTGESPQLNFSIAKCWSRSDPPFFKTFGMRDHESKKGSSEKCSTGPSTSASRNEVIIKLIDNFFDQNGLSVPVEAINRLVDTYTIAAYEDGMDVFTLSLDVQQAGQVIGLICGLYEMRKEVGNG